MSNYLVSGNTVKVFPDGALSVYGKLEPAVYNVSFSQDEGFFLTRDSNRIAVGKIYGSNVKEITDIVVAGFNARVALGSNTGVMFSGRKGCGKTLTTKSVCNTLLDAGIPVITVNSFFHPDGLASFIRSISDVCVVLIDEFEKNFSRKDGQQDAFLSLLDGVTNGKKLYLITCNDLDLVSSFLINRPGRIFYHFKFAGLTEDIVTEYCNEYLLHKEYIKAFHQIYFIMGEMFTFDILAALVLQSNISHASPIDVLSYMNIIYDNSVNQFLNVEVTCSHPDVKQVIKYNGSGEFYHDLKEMCDHMMYVQLTEEAAKKYKTESGDWDYTQLDLVFGSCDCDPVYTLPKRWLKQGVSTDDTILVKISSTLERIEFTSGGYRVNLDNGFIVDFVKREYNPWESMLSRSGTTDMGDPWDEFQSMASAEPPRKIGILRPIKSHREVPTRSVGAWGSTI